MARIGRTDEIRQRLRWTTSDLVLCTDDQWWSRRLGVSQVFRRPHFSRGGLRLLRRRTMTAAAEEGTHLTVLPLVMSERPRSFLPSFAAGERGGDSNRPRLQLRYVSLFFAGRDGLRTEGKERSLPSFLAL